MELKNLCCIVLPNLRTTGIYSVEHVCSKANYAILIFIDGVEKENKQTAGLVYNLLSRVNYFPNE